jgi:hypothetical protein
MFSPLRQATARRNACDPAGTSGPTLAWAIGLPPSAGRSRLAAGAACRGRCRGRAGPRPSRPDARAGPRWASRSSGMSWPANAGEPAEVAPLRPEPRCVASALARRLSPRRVEPARPSRGRGGAQPKAGLGSGAADAFCRRLRTTASSWCKAAVAACGTGAATPLRISTVVRIDGDRDQIIRRFRSNDATGGRSEGGQGGPIGPGTASAKLHRPSQFTVPTLPHLLSEPATGESAAGQADSPNLPK